MNTQEQTELLNFNTSLNEMDELWKLKTVAESDSHFFKIINFEGEFEWHVHDENKTLIVLEGAMHIDFDNKETIHLQKGDSFIVPENSKHKPVADGVCGILLIEKR